MKIDFNGNSLGWNDYIKNGWKHEGVMGPDRLFAKKWNEIQLQINHQEDFTEEFISQFPEVEPDHLFHRDRAAWFKQEGVPTKAEWEAA